MLGVKPNPIYSSTSTGETMPPPPLHTHTLPQTPELTQISSSSLQQW